MSEKRIGRPFNEPTPGKKSPLGLRVTAEIKGKLDAAAKASGRTQSQEAELRLEQSFRDDRVLAALERIEAKIGDQSIKTHYPSPSLANLVGLTYPPNPLVRNQESTGEPP